MFFGQKSRSLTLLAEGYLTRGARRWNWTILKVEFKKAVQIAQLFLMIA
jgi:hypothetical protein